jgi:NDP-sugar pyrophosphorylase family protein
MRAIILAGGRGTRLAPYTTIFPKPLMPIGEIPIIEIIIRQLRHFGFKRATLAVGYLSELLRAYIENNHKRFAAIDVDYIYEDEPTGTAGSLANISGLDDTFLVMNGDVLTTLDYTALIDHHRKSNAALTIATYRKPVKIDLGVIETNGSGYVCGYHEKPELDYFVSMGIYIYEPSVLRFVPRGQYLDFPDLVKRLLDAGELVSTYKCEGYWLDIGRPEDFQLAADQFASHRGEFNIE